MILHALEFTHVGPFRESIALGPFSPGLNVLAAPNESGKSTAVHAAARALFDRHSTKSEELKALQPAGTSLAPQVVVDFETRAGRFRITKTFLLRPESQLHQLRSGTWELIADADAADQRMQGLLQSSLPGRGATKPEHWGFLGFLWARQGEPAAWPALAEPGVGQNIRARLARVELDPIIEQLRARFATAAEAMLTSTGQPRTGGPLRTAEDDLAAIESTLAALRQTRAELDDTHRRYQLGEAEVARLESEHADRSAAATTLREQSLAAERLRGELEVRRQALATAQEKLAILTTDANSIAELRRQRADNETARAEALATVAGTEKALAALRTRLEAAQAEHHQQDATLLDLRAKLQRLQSLLNLRRQSATALALDRQATRAAAVAAEIAILENQRASLPALTPARLRKIEELHDSVRTFRAQLQALGLTVELTPDHDAIVTSGSPSTAPDSTAQIELPPGATHRLQSPHSLDLRLTGWGRVTIRSGSREAQTAATDLAQAETALTEALQDAGVPSLDAAREAVAQRKDFETRLKAAVAALAPHLGEHDSLASLREAAATATRRAAALAASLAPTEAEQNLSLTDLESGEAAHTEAVPAAEKAFAGLNQHLARLHVEERAAVESLQHATLGSVAHESRIHTLDTQIRDLVARYPDGLEAARTAAQIEFARAEARVIATQADLPADFEKLPERNRRAAASLQQIANELLARRAERDQARGILESLGGQGLYSRETELEERRAEALLRRDAARARGWCARVAHDLIEYRKQAATKAVLTPLENRLTTAFGELTGNTTRRVYLDEHLQITGIGRTREECHAFDQLSQGAKEQLLLCLRLAVAQELATEEPQVLILDDVLVNTDQIRQERILDVLVAQAERLQILILTCHPDRYRGTGNPLFLRSK